MNSNQSTAPDKKKLFVRAGIATFLGAFVMYPAGDPLSGMIWGCYAAGAVTLVLWLLLRFTNCLTGTALKRRLIVNGVVFGAVILSCLIPELIGSSPEWPPSEQTVRSDFKKEHPDFALESLTDKTNDSTTTFAITFRKPGDTVPHYEEQVYGVTNGGQFQAVSTR